MSAALLHVSGLGVSYGGVRAVDDLSFDVAPAQMVGLIGPNGAGKTTTIDAICGFAPHTGVVELHGRELSSASPSQRARAGLARTWQSVELFEDLTVRQHCQVTAHRVGLRDLVADVVRPSRTRNDAAVDDALELLGLSDVAEELPVELPHGTQKLVGVARALAGGPRMLLLDEPAAGLDTAESRELGAHLRRIVGRGVSVLLVDHDTQLVFDICDRVMVLDFGSLIADGPPAEVRHNRAVLEAYLGVGSQPGAGGSEEAER
jgi:ABC-type branched-subunit amino acid transport system ATPase component